MSNFKKILLGLLTLLVAASLLIALYFLLSNTKTSASNGVRADNSAPAVNLPSDRNKSAETGKGNEAAGLLSVRDLKDTGLLRLVNSRYGIKSEPAENLVNSADGLYRYNKAITKQLSAFFQYGAEHKNEMYISSAFRSLSDQKEIYDATKDKSLVQIPGNSEHQTGLAVDLQPAKALKGYQGNSLKKEKQFMEENSWKFGFILRYPEGKQAVTGISFEYWHYRYVGNPHAEYMYKNKLVLEEYLELLKAKGQLRINGAEGKYSVYWLEPEAGKVRIPEGGTYEISSTNTGAFVLTQKTGG